MVQYSTSSSRSYIYNQAFNYQVGSWFFIGISYELDTGYISFFAWQPSKDLVLKTLRISLGSGFHSNFDASTLLQILYWGNYKRFCGSIDKFIYFPQYSFQNELQWYNYALVDNQLKFQQLFYYRFEVANSQIVSDFGNKLQKNDLDIKSLAITPQKGLELEKSVFLSINDFAWNNQKAFVISFWIIIPTGFQINSGELVLFSKLTKKTLFQVLVYIPLSNPKAFSIKIKLNNNQYSDDSINFTIGNTPFQVQISLALPDSGFGYNEKYVLKVDYSGGKTSGYIYYSVGTDNFWDETEQVSTQIGSSSNDFTGKIYISHLKLIEGFQLFIGNINTDCMQNCSSTFATFGYIQCLRCSYTYFEQNGQCFSSCPSSLYGMNNTPFRTCSLCDAACQKCTGAFSTAVSPLPVTDTINCTACTANYFIESSNMCVATCTATKVGNTKTQTCTLCGNGNMDIGENCDDQNFNDNDGCTNCQIDFGYVCDNSTPPSVCTLKCGNGKRTVDEECDDGNYINNDGCTNCIIDPGYQCTGGTPTTSDTCIKLCGNGIQDSFEECDDGNQIAGDGCTNCTVDIGFQCIGFGIGTCVKLCGDLKRDQYEQCDVGPSANAISQAGCQNCKITIGYSCTGGSNTSNDVCTKLCGNGVRDIGEECDDGNTLSGDGCSSDCEIEQDYYCENGSITSKDICTALLAICGDGRRHSTEQCDDEKQSLGCQTCQITKGYECKGGTTKTADKCKIICGDGIKVKYEECDDGNTIAGDGCDQNCQIERNYVCTPSLDVFQESPSICENKCGNGQRDQNEECDDENTNNFDGCSEFCTIELGFGCENFVEGGRDNCFKCVQNCARCNGKAIENCIQCLPGNFMNQRTNQCQQSCPQSFYPNLLNQQCIECKEKNCQTCSSSKEKSCLRCYQNYLLHKGKCYENYCPEGSFSFLNPLIGLECKICKFPCAICGSESDCFECTDLYYLEKKTGSCELCNMDSKCLQCTFEEKLCTKCTLGYYPEKDACLEIREACGDGYYHLKEECDDGNNTNGDGCSSECKIETGFKCKLLKNEGPFQCFENRMTLVYLKQSKTSYSNMYIVFERILKKKPSKLDSVIDIQLKIENLNQKLYNYTAFFISNNTIRVEFQFQNTIRNKKIALNFGEYFQSIVTDAHGYQWDGNFKPVQSDMSYFIKYTSDEVKQAESVAISFVVLSLLAITGVSIGYIYNFGQGRIYKFVEILQSIGLLRFLNVRHDILAQKMFFYIDLIYNMRAMYNPLIKAGNNKIISNEQINNYIFVRQEILNLNFLQNAFGTALLIFAIMFFIQILNYIILKVVKNEKVNYLSESFHKHMKFSGYLRMFEWLFYYFLVSFFAFFQQNSFFSNQLEIASFSICVLFMIFLIFITFFLFKKVILYKNISQRTDYFEKFKCIFDGIQFDILKARVYIFFPYFLKILYVIFILFLYEFPTIQIFMCIFCRLLNIILVFTLNPFHFPFIKLKEVASEMFLIVFLAIQFFAIDENTLQSTQRITSISLIVLLYIFVLGYCFTILWTFIQDDIIFEPHMIVPDNFNPNDWIEKKQSNKVFPIPQNDIHQQQDEINNDMHDDFGKIQQFDKIQKNDSEYINQEQTDNN
ncbi:hypothetical protein IMG5_116120 [Ichthyophthirius multifiliis]|uniref:Insulin-like growth factor binding protein, N-terminal n=1 Tax=Ichthyophthirius multifiliis TaxID=5932 RepID=G0QUB4_ICHMU|nr:hypothetical protein IMG5_116120 [Ichthyophthirius multifiliis]EGR31186.1 hypothetical protein IMG5_116120 [Ichthyophthirius multifiliis]|eukprot:XP_004034672.1 hypothetical protein IMG5_116120 [Ichthyophthirius multifiliis]